MDAGGGERRRERERRKRRGDMGLICGPTATWQPHQRNYFAKPPDGQN
jgi:hypothetical protein